MHVAARMRRSKITPASHSPDTHQSDMDIPENRPHVHQVNDAGAMAPAVSADEIARPACATETPKCTLYFYLVSDVGEQQTGWQRHPHGFTIVDITKWVGGDAANPKASTEKALGDEHPLFSKLLDKVTKQPEAFLVSRQKPVDVKGNLIPKEHNGPMTLHRKEGDTLTVLAWEFTGSSFRDLCKHYAKNTPFHSEITELWVWPRCEQETCLKEQNKPGGKVRLAKNYKEGRGICKKCSGAVSKRKLTSGDVAVDGNAPTAAAVKRLKLETCVESDVHGYTPLHTAAAQGDLKEVRRLVAAGFDVNVRSNTGSTPLHQAGYSARVATVKWLLSHDADPMAKTDKGPPPLGPAIICYPAMFPVYWTIFYRRRVPHPSIQKSYNVAFGTCSNTLLLLFFIFFGGAGKWHPIHNAATQGARRMWQGKADQERFRRCVELLGKATIKAKGLLMHQCMVNADAMADEADCLDCPGKQCDTPAWRCLAKVCTGCDKRTVQKFPGSHGNSKLLKDCFPDRFKPSCTGLKVCTCSQASAVSSGSTKS